MHACGPQGVWGAVPEGYFLSLGPFLAGGRACISVKVFSQSVPSWEYLQAAILPGVHQSFP
jgi:hypothetical protein